MYEKEFGRMNEKDEMKFEEALTHEIIDLALREDRVREDVTTNSLTDCDRQVTAKVTAKSPGIISGTDVFRSVFHKVDPAVSIEILQKDGSAVQKGDLVMRIKGMESSILKAERTALNFMQRLSGIATMTSQYVAKLAPFDITLLDTRKTTPGMRYLEKKPLKTAAAQTTA